MDWSTIFFIEPQSRSKERRVAIKRSPANSKSLVWVLWSNFYYNPCRRNQTCPFRSTQTA